MSPTHVRIFLCYLIPFAFFFLVLSTVLHSQLRTNGSLAREMIINVILLSIGFVGLLLFHYIPLLTGGTLMWPNESLRGIIAIQVVPLLIIVAIVSTYFYRKTGHVYVGAFLNAIFITWYIVAGQATHFAV